MATQEHQEKINNTPLMGCRPAWPMRAHGQHRGPTWGKDVAVVVVVVAAAADDDDDDDDTCSNRKW